jgi:hypothetical protein
LLARKRLEPGDKVQKNETPRSYNHLLGSTGEYACHEGNYSMRDMLEAARARGGKESIAVVPANLK